MYDIIGKKRKIEKMMNCTKIPQLVKKKVKIITAPYFSLFKTLNITCQCLMKLKLYP